jgi:hypothetical protein
VIPRNGWVFLARLLITSEPVTKRIVKAKELRFHQFAKFSLMIDLTAPYVLRRARSKLRTKSTQTLMVPSQSDGRNERERFRC